MLFIMCVKNKLDLVFNNICINNLLKVEILFHKNVRILSAIRRSSFLDFNQLVRWLYKKFYLLGFPTNEFASVLDSKYIAFC